jgi:hypothetical protein
MSRAMPPAPPAAPSVGDLERLIAESEESIKRLDQLQKRPTFGQRASAHLRKHGNNLVSAALAGSVLVVAVGRLTQKYQHEVGAQLLGFSALCQLKNVSVILL